MLRTLSRLGGQHMQLTNAEALPISIAVWLGTDDYDHSDDPYLISATTFNKPMRAIVLARQNKELDKGGDVASLIPSSMGTAIHNSIENAWLHRDNLTKVMSQLNYPQALIDRVIVNPTPDQLTESSIPVYMEKRGQRKLNGFTISGKFDFVVEGMLEDFKSTGTYGYVNGSNSNDYIQQGSIYRWLHQDIITQDHMNIRFIFTDWSSMQARSDKSYPQSRIVSKMYPLMGISETETFLKQKTNQINTLMPLSQDRLPLCTPTELWQKPDAWKYYKNPAKRTRSTKNYDTEGEAHAHLMKDGNVGVVVKFPGTVMRCKYCDVNEICHQAKSLVAQKLLVL